MNSFHIFSPKFITTGGQQPLKILKNPEIVDAPENVPELSWKLGWSLKKYEVR